MFYFIVSKLPFIYRDDDSRGKLFKIFIIGTLCYIILHAFLYSGYSTGIELIQKYRSYIYYVWGADLLMTSLFTLMFEQKQVQQENLIEESDDETEMTETTMNRPNITKEEIERQKEETIRQLEEIKKNSTPSPFIKKGQQDSVDVSDTHISTYEVPKLNLTK